MEVGEQKNTEVSSMQKNSKRETSYRVETEDFSGRQIKSYGIPSISNHKFSSIKSNPTFRQFHDFTDQYTQRLISKEPEHQNVLFSGNCSDLWNYINIQKISKQSKNVLKNAQTKLKRLQKLGQIYCLQMSLQSCSRQSELSIKLRKDIEESFMQPIVIELDDFLFKNLGSQRKTLGLKESIQFHNMESQAAISEVKALLYYALNFIYKMSNRAIVESSIVVQGLQTECFKNMLLSLFLRIHLKQHKRSQQNFRKFTQPIKFLIQKNGSKKICHFTNDAAKSIQNTEIQSIIAKYFQLKH